MFTHPLDNIRVASPCPAAWDQMFGDERRRFCSESKLNVYNLSGMTRREAENLLLNSEGRLCIRYFRQADGTVLTKDCPVGWAALKRRVSRAATAVISMLFGFATGLIGIRSTETFISLIPVGDVPTPAFLLQAEETVPMVGQVVMGEETDFEYQGTPVVVREPSKKNKSSRRLNKSR